MSAITIENDLVHYEVLGRGRPVVFIHGWLGSWRYWVPTMQQLSMKYRTYALDLWGFGDSGKDTNRYGLKDQVQLLHDFFERLGIPKAALIGHSFGAAVCLNFARQYPERVHRMMLISPPLFDVGGLGEEHAIQAPVVAVPASAVPVTAPASPTAVATPAAPVVGAPTTTTPPTQPTPTAPAVPPTATVPTTPPSQAVPTAPTTAPAVPPAATVPTTPPSQAAPSTAANPTAAASAPPSTPPSASPSAPSTPPTATAPATSAVPPSVTNPKPAIPVTPAPAAGTPPAAHEAVSTPGAPYYSATSETVPRNPFRTRSETPEEILARLRAKNMNTSGQPGAPTAPSATPNTAGTTGPSTQSIPTPVQGPSTAPKPSTPLLPSAIAKPILPATGPLTSPSPSAAESVASPVPPPVRSGDASSNPLIPILTGVKPVALLLKHVDRDIPDLDTLRAEVEKTDENALLKSAQSFAGVNLALELKRLAAPTLLLHGENDSLLPPPSEDLLRRINAGKQAGHFLTLVEPELRHFPMLEVTAKFNRLLIDFLEATDLTNVQFKDQWKRTMR